MRLSRYSFALAVVIGCAPVLAAMAEDGPPLARYRGGSDAPLPLTEFLCVEGMDLDCYFTIEERTDSEHEAASRYTGISNFLRLTPRPASVSQLIERLNKELDGFLAVIDPYNPRVVHIIDVTLSKADGYILDEPTTVNYKGGPQSLVSELSKLKGGRVHGLHRGFLIGVDHMRVDMKTQIRVHADKLPVRDILTRFLPLSRYDRILWVVEAYPKDGKTNAYVQFRGAPVTPPPLENWWAAPVPVPFYDGEIAYDYNEESDACTAEAVRFLRAGMDTPEKRQVRWTMLFLGKCKAERAIPTLLEYIDYSYTTCDIVEESYPAVQALSMLGKPAAIAALKEIADKDDSELRVGLLSRVIRNVRGVSAATEDLNAAIHGAADDQAKKRLELALKLVEEE